MDGFIATPPATGDDDLELDLAYAQTLDLAGDDDAARAAYIEILGRDPGHFGALSGLGALLRRTGLPRSARRAFTEAVRLHPEIPSGHANLANALLDAGEVVAARRHYEAALRLDPEHAHAHQGLAVLLLRLGDVEAAQRHGRLGFASVTEWPYRGEGAGVPILLAFSALGGNVNTSPEVFDDRVFRKATLVAEFCPPDVALPAHDVVFNGIGDADLCAAGLQAIEPVLARTRAPVVNRPAAVLATTRVANARRLGALPGVVTAATAAFPRSVLAGASAEAALAAGGFAFPLLLRAPGFHTGKHFVRVERAAELAGAVAQLPGDELLAIAFVDVRAADGKYRKYRALFVDGALYPLHVAVARDWMVHYFTAAMDDAAHRAEEAAFLADMPGTIGPEAVRALERVRDALGLDYGGVDFAFGRDGRLVVFEANATMVFLRPRPDPETAYRLPAVERIGEAVRAMLVRRATRARSEGPAP